MEKTKKIKPKGEIYEETYGARIVLLNPCSASELAQYVKQETGVDLSKRPHPEFNGYVIHLVGLEHVIALRLKWTGDIWQSGTLSHEVVHLAESILWCRDLKHTRKTSEAWAYLHGSLVRRLLELLRK